MNKTKANLEFKRSPSYKNNQLGHDELLTNPSPL